MEYLDNKPGNGPKLAKDTGVASVAPPLINKKQKVALITIVPKTAPTDTATQSLVSRLPKEVQTVTGPGVNVYATGVTAGLLGLSDRIAERLPWFIGAVILLSFILLLIEFRSVFVPLKAAQQRLLGGRLIKPDSVQQIGVLGRDAKALDVLERDLAELLRDRHAIVPGRSDDFTIRNVSEVFEARAGATQVMTLLLAAVASVSLLVGGIGIMNIMLVSVTERTREIGLRKAVGARRGDILRQFLTEATTLALMGGIAGIALGVGAAAAIANFAGWPTLIRLDSMVLGVTFSAAVGVFFGFYPARKAARLNPIEALRFE